jgi:hypothetical protein
MEVHKDWLLVESDDLQDIQKNPIDFLEVWLNFRVKADLESISSLAPFPTASFAFGMSDQVAAKKRALEPLEGPSSKRQALDSTNADNEERGME